MDCNSLDLFFRHSMNSIQFNPHSPSIQHCYGIILSIFRCTLTTGVQIDRGTIVNNSPEFNLSLWAILFHLFHFISHKFDMHQTKRKTTFSPIQANIFEKHTIRYFKISRTRNRSNFQNTKID